MCGLDNLFGLEFVNVYKNYNKTIPSKIELVGCTVNEIINFIIDNITFIDENTLFELKVILNELIVNAVIHGNKENVDKLVKISLMLTLDESVILMIADDGEGYDYQYYLNRSNELNDIGMIQWNEIEESGRGITIVKNLCDRIEINQKGNEIYILKSLKNVK